MSNQRAIERASRGGLSVGTSPDIETGVLFCDDNLERLPGLAENSVDLIYLDPPFFSNRVYEVIWGEEAEIRSFEDRWAGGLEHYVGWMQDRRMSRRSWNLVTASMDDPTPRP